MNLVAMMLEGAGFEVVDLGTDVSPEVFIAAEQEHKPALVAMSALLTTTMINMKAVITWWIVQVQFFAITLLLSRAVKNVFWVVGRTGLAINNCYCSHAMGSIDAVLEESIGWIEM